MSERTIVIAHQVLAGQRRGVRGCLAFVGPAVIASIAYIDPGQLCDQYPGRREIRLRAALGGAARQSDCDAVPGAVGQTRHRHRPQPRGAVPRSFPAPGGLGDVGRQRDRRHGDRSRRVSRRRHRTVALVPDAAVCRNGRHRRRDLRHPDVRGLRVPADRTDHRRHRRLHRRSAISSRCSLLRSIGARRYITPSCRRSPTPRRCCLPSASSAQP